MNMMKFKTSKTSRVLLHKGQSGKCFIVLHGYGMNVNRFYRSIDMIVENGHSLVVPEALSRYYNTGASGKVVASWMTSDERSDDILDNHNYLRELIDRLKAEGAFDDIEQMFLVGYSQGAATAARFAFMEHSSIDYLILWGSDLPTDLSEDILRSNRNSLKVHFIVGDSDEYVKIENVTESMAKLSKLDVSTDMYIYNGRHKVTEVALTHLIKI